MVFQWFWGCPTIGFNGFRWSRTIGRTMEWFQWIEQVYTNHTNEIHTAALPHSYVVLSCGSNLRLEETGELQLQCLQNFGYATKSSLEVPVPVSRSSFL